MRRTLIGCFILSCIVSSGFVVKPVLAAQSIADIQVPTDTPTATPPAAVSPLSTPSIASSTTPLPTKLPQTGVAEWTLVLLLVSAVGGIAGFVYTSRQES